MPSSAKTHAALFAVLVAVEVLAVVEGGILGLERQKRYLPNRPPSNYHGHIHGEDGEYHVHGRTKPIPGLKRATVKICQTDADCPPDEKCDFIPCGGPDPVCFPRHYAKNYKRAMC